MFFSRPIPNKYLKNENVIKYLHFEIIQCVFISVAEPKPFFFQPAPEKPKPLFSNNDSGATVFSLAAPEP